LVNSLRGTIVSIGLAALLVVAGVGGARAEAGKTASGKAATGKAEAGKTATGKAAAGKAAAGKTAAGKTAAKGATADPATAPTAGWPANPALKDWLAKAGADSFFLVLDPEAGKLELVLGGVVMRTFEVVDVQVATPRRLGSAAPLPDDWHERVWTGASLDPPHPGARTEIVGPEIGTADAAVLIPPTPEEAIPVPGMFRLRFAEGLAIEITGGIAEQKGELPPTELPRGFKDKIRMLREGMPDRLRLRICLKPEAASELYRCLPPGTDFVVHHSAK
jgi:hypothetical protein